MEGGRISVQASIYAPFTIIGAAVHLQVPAPRPDPILIIFSACPSIIMRSFASFLLFWRAPNHVNPVSCCCSVAIPVGSSVEQWSVQEVLIDFMPSKIARFHICSFMTMVDRRDMLTFLPQPGQHYLPRARERPLVFPRLVLPPTERIW